MSWRPPWYPDPPHDGFWSSDSIEHVREADCGVWARHFVCDACGQPAHNRLSYLPGPVLNTHWSCDAHVEQVSVMVAVTADRRPR